MREPSGVMATSRWTPDSANAVDPDVVIVVRTTCGGAGRVANHTEAPATMPATSAATVSAATRRHSSLRGSGAADVELAGGARLAPFSNTNTAVEISATRRRRSLVRQL